MNLRLWQPSRPRAPSWSWAALDGQIEWPLLEHHLGQEAAARLVGVSVAKRSADDEKRL